MQKKSVYEKKHEKRKRIWKKILQRRANINTETINSGSEGKCGKTTEKHWLNPGSSRIEGSERERERILFVQIEATDQADCALKNQLVISFGENIIVVNRERF